MSTNNNITVIKVQKSALDSIVSKFEQTFSNQFLKLQPSNEYEFSRYSFSNSTVIIYKSGKVVISGREIEKLRDFFVEFSELNKGDNKFRYLIGIDETGKGEIIGSIIICGVLIDTSVTDLKEIEKIISGIDTKGKKQNIKKYEEVFQKIISLGVQHKIQEISPEELKPKKTNLIMTEKVIKLLGELTLNIRELNSLRITIDDFGFKAKDRIKEKYNLSEVIIEPKADDNYIECKAASIISRYYREKFLEYINSLEEYTIEGIKPLNGNLADPNTIEWLKKWKETKGKLPKFVKKWNIPRK
jgi:ribonuclease HII